MQHVRQGEPLLSQRLLLTPQQRPGAGPSAQIQRGDQGSELIPQPVVNLLLGSRHGGAPKRGDSTHLLSRDARHRVRLTQPAPAVKAILNHRPVDERSLLLSGGMGDKHLHQLRLADQTQAQRKCVVNVLDVGREAQRHTGQGMAWIDMAQVVETLLARFDIHPAVAAVTQGGEQMRLRRLRVAIETYRAGLASGAGQHALMRGRGGQTQQQGVGIIVKQRSMLTGFVYPCH